jgi:hypothetical protein
MRNNSNLDMLKQMVKGLTDRERDELLSDMLSNPADSHRSLPAPRLPSEGSIIQQSVDLIADLHYEDYGLEDYQAMFCAEYLQNGFNATRAYIAVVAPGMDPVVAKSASARLRNHPNVARYLEVLFEHLVISNSEIQLRLQDMLTVSMEDFLDESGEKIDLRKAYEMGALRGVQRLRKTEHGWDIQLYDRTKAIDIFTRVRGMQKQVKITADLDKIAQEHNVPAADLQAYKERVKSQLKQQLRAGRNE